MKIRIKESQLKKILNEVGGYDYVDIMVFMGEVYMVKLRE